MRTANDDAFCCKQLQEFATDRNRTAIRCFEKETALDSRRPYGRRPRRKELENPLRTVWKNRARLQSKSETVAESGKRHALDHGDDMVEFPIVTHILHHLAGVDDRGAIPRKS